MVDAHFRSARAATARLLKLTKGSQAACLNCATCEPDMTGCVIYAARIIRSVAEIEHVSNLEIVDLSQHRQDGCCNLQEDTARQNQLPVIYGSFRKWQEVYGSWSCNTSRACRNRWHARHTCARLRVVFPQQQTSTYPVDAQTYPTYILVLTLPTKRVPFAAMACCRLLKLLARSLPLQVNVSPVHCSCAANNHAGHKTRQRQEE